MFTYWLDVNVGSFPSNVAPASSMSVDVRFTDNTTQRFFPAEYVRSTTGGYRQMKGVLQIPMNTTKTAASFTVAFFSEVKNQGTSAITFNTSDRQTWARFDDLTIEKQPDILPVNTGFEFGTLAGWKQEVTYPVYTFWVDGVSRFGSNATQIGATWGAALPAGQWSYGLLRSVVEVPCSSGQTYSLSAWIQAETVGLPAGVDETAGILLDLKFTDGTTQRYFPLPFIKGTTAGGVNRYVNQSGTFTIPTVAGKTVRSFSLAPFLEVDNLSSVAFTFGQGLSAYAHFDDVLVKRDSGIAVAISPASASVVAGQSQQFTATVTGSTNTAVTWTVDPPSAGTISGTGLFTAASGIATPTSITIRANSVADTIKTAASAVTVQPLAAQACSISPTSWTVANAGGTKSVAVTCSSSVPWVAVPAAGWLHVSPSSGTGSGTVTITADAYGVGTPARAATVTIATKTFTMSQSAASTLSVNPTAVSLAHDAQQQFTAVLNGTSANGAVTWSLQGVGSISTTGLYTAPSVIQPNQTTTTVTARDIPGNAAASAVVNLAEYVPPSGYVLSPSSGTALNQTFHLTITDIHGASSINQVYVNFASTSSEFANACYLTINTNTNLAGTPAADSVKVSLMGAGWSFPLQVGASGSVESAACRFFGTGSAIARSGNTMTIDLNMAFKPGFVGGKGAYVQADNQQGATSGWVPVGGWDLQSNVASTAPTLAVDAPAAGATVQGNTSISGWALDNTNRRENAVTGVEIYVDNAYYMNAQRIPRPDVCAGTLLDRMDCPNAGFSLAWNTTVVSNGTHTIKVRAVDSDYPPKVTEITRSITVNNAPAVPLVLSPASSIVRVWYSTSAPQNSMEKQQFTATAGGVSVSDVTWSMTPAASNDTGSISSTGLYSAPYLSNSVGSVFTISGQRTSIPTQTGTATVLLAGILLCGGTPELVITSGAETPQYCSASDPLTNFTLSPAAGSIDAYNRYIPPSSNGTYKQILVEARSAYNQNKRYRATITLGVY